MRQLDSSIGQSIAEEQKIAATNVANGEKTLSGISAIEQGESCPRLLVHPDGPQKGLTQNTDRKRFTIRVRPRRRGAISSSENGTPNISR